MHALKLLLACNKTLLVIITLVGHKCSPSWVVKHEGFLLFVNARSSHVQVVPFVFWYVEWMMSCFHHLVGGTKVSSFFPWLVAWMASYLLILEYGLYISSLGWWHEWEYGLYISSPSLWGEDEFLLHLVGGMNGKLPNDIRVWVVHFIT